MIQIFALLLSLISPAMAQCSGTFPPNTVCGNATGTQGQGKPTTVSSFPGGGGGGGGGGASNITRTQIATTNLTGVTSITVNGYLVANDAGFGAVYTQTGATCPSGWGAIKDSAGNCFNILIKNNVYPGWFGAKADNGATTISSGDIAANTQWRGTYTAGTTWDYVGVQESAYRAFALNSTPGSIVWNNQSGGGAAGFQSNVEWDIPNGTYGLSNTVVTAIQAGRVVFQGKGSAIFSGTAGKTTWQCSYCSYTQFFNVTIANTGAVSVGGALPAWLWDDSLSITALEVQQNTVYDCNISVGVNGQGFQINTSSQGDTNTFIGCIFTGNQSDYAVNLKGQNTLDNVFINGDFQHFTNNGIVLGGGQLQTFGTHSENFAANPFQFGPVLNQITTYGGDINITNQVNGSSPSMMQGWRAEDSVLIQSSGNWNSNNGIDVYSSSAIGVDFNAWTTGLWFQPGYLVDSANNNTKKRNFILVDNGGTQWKAITSGNAGASTITDSTASYTVNQWANFVVQMRFSSNGFISSCGIISNTATVISYDPACGTGFSSQNEYQISGVTGVSEPNWDSASTGLQAFQPGNAGRAFSTHATTNCIDVGSSTTPTTNQYVVIPNARQLTPVSGFSIKYALIAKVTGTAATACGGGGGSSITVNQTPELTVTNAAGYYGTGITDGQETWMNVAYDTVYQANVINDLGGGGQVAATGTIFNMRLSRPDWQDPTNSPSPTVASINYDFGAKSQAACNSLVSPSSPLDITTYLNQCNYLPIQPGGNLTINFPAVPSISTQLIFLWFKGGSNNIITFGTNSTSNGVLNLGSNTNAAFLVAFVAQPGSDALPSWYEIARSTVGGAGTNSTVSSPTGPNSTSVFKMQGLAGTITPQKTGSVSLTICGTIIETGITAAGSGISYQLSYGTSTAPTSNAALTGTQIGTVGEYMLAQTVTAADVFVPFCQTAQVTGLTIGTAYWLDLAAEAVANTGFSFSNVNIAAHEF